MAKVKLEKTTTSDRIGTPTSIKNYVGFSTVNRDFDNNVLYDYELARTDLLNHFHIKKGEKLENPNFGTIIHDLLFENFSPDISKAVEDDVVEIVGYDPRWRLDTLQIEGEEHGLNINLEITYTPFNISENLNLLFNQDSQAPIVSSNTESGASSTGSASY
jgi:phage baseplate assembly protein W